MDTLPRQPERLRTLLIPDLATVQDLAPFFKISVSGMRAMLRRGALPAKKVGRRWIVSRRFLLAAIEQADPADTELEQGSEAGRGL